MGSVSTSQELGQTSPNPCLTPGRATPTPPPSLRPAGPAPAGAPRADCGSEAHAGAHRQAPRLGSGPTRCRRSAPWRA